MSETVIVKEREGGIYTQDVHTSRHHLYADEPESYGSADLGPTPYEYLCAALGACTSITLRMYAARKVWDVGQISVAVSHEKVKTENGKTRDVFTRELTFTGDILQTQRDRLLHIANKCPVHKTIEAQSEVKTNVSMS